MTKEQSEAIEYFMDRIKDATPRYTEILVDGKIIKEEVYPIKMRFDQEDAEKMKTVLNMLKEKDKEIEKKDNAVKRIINRLDNDIKRITETKRDKSTFPNYLDDYTKCRLKAYRTKTKEIKEYIEEQYFERKATNDG